MNIIAMVVKIHLVIINFGLRNLASLASIGILITAHELSITTIFDILAPFCSKVLHTGNAAYMGPAETLPRAREIKEPFNPDPSPNALTIISFGTQASIKAVSKNTTGIMTNISFK
jgi:hypothetical protein